MLEEIRRRNVHRVVIAYLAGAWLVLQIADLLWDIYDLPKAILPMLSNLLVVGLIPAVIVAWVFEWTPAGIQRDTGARAGAPQPARDARRMDRAIIIVLALAVTVLVVDRFVLRESEPVSSHAERIEALRSTYDNRSIAVLEFENLSADPDQAYFAAGVTETILDLLSKIEDLRVVPQVSENLAAQGIKKIANELDIAYVLQGSVRRSGDDLRITARLIDARDNSNVWSETYARKLTSIFAIQDEIANHVAQRLEINLTGQSLRSWTTTPDLYLDFMRVWLAIRNGVNKAEYAEILESILEQDPDYLPAIYQLWQAYRFMAINPDSDAAQVDELRSLRKRLLDRALTLDPDDATVNAMYAWYLLEDERNLAAAVPAMERAYRLEPGNVYVRDYVTAFARRLGKYEVASRLNEKSIAIDPQCADCYLGLAFIDYAQRRYEESIWASRQRHKLGAVGGWYTLGFAQLLGGNARDALESFDRQTMADSAGWHAARAMALFTLGQVDEFQAARQYAEQKLTERDALYLALMYAWIEEPDNAFAMLAQGYQAGDFRIANKVSDPIFDSLRDDPRWDPFVELVWFPEDELANVTLNIP